MEIEDTHNFVANGIIVHNCISYAEFSACGGVFVGPWKAALPETAGGTGILIRDDGSIGRSGDPLDKGLGPVSAKFCDRMADEVVDLIHNDERWETLSKTGRKRAEKWTWDEVAEDWTRLAHELIGQRTSEPKRVAKHFLVNCDVVAAKRYADHLGDERLRKSVRHYVDRFVPFMNIEDEAERKEAIAKFYEERSGGEAATWQTAFWADTEPRTRVLIDWIAQHKDEVGSVLDFGCAHGGYARALSNAFSSLRVLGADVSPSLIRCAKELREAKMPDGNPACLHQENLQFLIGDEDTEIWTDGKSYRYEPSTDAEYKSVLGVGEFEPRGGLAKFDLVIAMEVLEHLPNAEEVAKKLERHCKPGGWICFTIPHGHRERDEFVTKGVMPVHVRSFDKHDLMDIFGEREGFHVVAFSDFKELDYDRTLAGWFMVFYKDDVRIGTSPFWCYVHKVRHPQDQILPGVCDIAGFETPRNESTQGAWGDFIFWLDSDESLLNWQQVWQYLRPNSYLGYAINQHHLAVEPHGSLKKDIPVRLFRNHQGMRCFGKVHEHFELAINAGVGPHVVVLPLDIHHDGYLTEPIRRGRFARNIKLLECDRLKYPDRLLGIYLYDVRDNVHMARYQMECNGGVVDETAQRHAWHAIETFRKHFLAKDVMLAQDGINYYGDALHILGLGIEMAIDLDVKREGAHLNGGVLRFRVADYNEAKLVTDQLLRQRFGPFEGRYVS